MIVTSVQSATFNHQQAWEVRGTDREGTVWMVFILHTGDLVYQEPIAHHPPPSVEEPVPDF